MRLCCISLAAISLEEKCRQYDGIVVTATRSCQSQWKCHHNDGTYISVHRTSTLSGWYFSIYSQHVVRLLSLMMTSWHGDVSRVNGPLWGESIGRAGFPSQRASNAELNLMFPLLLISTNCSTNSRVASYLRRNGTALMSMQCYILSYMKVRHRLRHMSVLRVIVMENWYSISDWQKWYDKRVTFARYCTPHILRANSLLVSIFLKTHCFVGYVIGLRTDHEPCWFHSDAIRGLHNHQGTVSLRVIMTQFDIFTWIQEHVMHTLHMLGMIHLFQFQ